MALSLTDHRYRVRAAKGNVTKVGKEARLLCDVTVEKLDVSMMNKLQKALSKADEAFKSHHQSLFEEDETIDEDQHDEDLAEHQSLVDQYRDTLLGLQHKHEVTAVIAELTVTLEDLELNLEAGYSPDMDPDLDGLRSLSKRMRQARSKPAARECPVIKAASDAVNKRLLHLQRARDTARAARASEVSPPPEASTPKFAPSAANSLKMKLPTFDGTIINWLEFWKLFSSLLSQQHHLSDDVKQAHLIASMGTPECKRQAEAAFAYTKSYDEAVARLRKHYEQNRVLLTHYIKRVLTPARFQNKKRDIDRMADMMERNLTGMQKANGYTASQVFAVVFEGYMEPCLDAEWRKRTEDHTEPPTAEEMIEFLWKQSRAVPDDSDDETDRESHSKPRRSAKPAKRTIMRTQLTSDKCLCCQANHVLYSCPQFKQKAVRQRRDWVKTKDLCFNCMSPHHRSSDCPSKHRCRECSTKHHTLLHEPRAPSRTEGAEATVNIAASRMPVTPHHSISRTAIVTVRAQGLEQRARAQMDSGATISLITRALANTLKARRVPNSGTKICGVGGTYSSPHQVKVTLIGHGGDGFASLFHVVDSITDSRADISHIFHLPFLEGLTLADPSYTPSAHIDLLLDMGTTNVCSRDGVRHSADRALRAEHTVFGWTVEGHHFNPDQTIDPSHTCLQASATKEDPATLLKRFWDMERLPSEEKPLTSEEQQAVRHFYETILRDPDGRYRVTPLEAPYSHSRQIQRDCYAQIHQQREIPPTIGDMGTIQDALLTGPSLYPLLTTIVNKFRMHPIGLTADITRMFREVGLNHADQDYHRFLLRDQDGIFQEWKMTRLTFGVSSSPYLATQVLLKMAQDYRLEHPLAARAVEESFYVDDCLIGASNLKEAQEIREDLNSLLNKPQMTLCKWRTNSVALLESIPEHLRETTDLEIATSPGRCPKALGLHWSTAKDSLHVATPTIDPSEPATKRLVASAVARTFDAMGWFSPSTLPAKILIQSAWALRLGWDDPLPEKLQLKWRSWTAQLPQITLHPIPRHYGVPNKTVVAQQLHGFSDASTLAYGGAVYIRTFYADTEVVVSLVSSKAKVAPLKTLTIPRLELCGALLLSHLLDTFASDLSTPKISIYAWSDSSAVLGWINKDPNKLTTFVSNRVLKLTSLIAPSQWRYVSTIHNPADCLSRGVLPQELMSTRLWWEGPPWLRQDLSCWPHRPDINFDRELPEIKHTVLHLVPAPTELGIDVSTFERLVRVMAWVWRFYSSVKNKLKLLSATFSSAPILSLRELRHAKVLLLRHSQRIHFAAEFILLEKKQPLPRSNPLSSLVPYIDEEGLVRVGGRLQKAGLSVAHTHSHPEHQV